AMLPLSRWPAPTGPLVLRIAPSTGLGGRPPPPGRAPATTVSAARAVMARPSVLAALPLAPRPPVATPTPITSGLAVAVAAACTAWASPAAALWPVRTLRARPRSSARWYPTSVWRGCGILSVPLVAVLSLAGHHIPSPLFKYVPSLPAAVVWIGGCLGLGVC